MFRYRLSPTYEPDIIIVLDASHVEAFAQAANAAQRIMETMGQGQAALGILKSPNTLHIGRVEFSNATILEPSHVEDFGSKLLLTEQRANVTLLRNACTGHLKSAMIAALNSLRAISIRLIFYKGGPIFVLSPREPKGQYQLASIRFQGANNIRDERLCVRVNRASKNAYRDIWGVLSKQFLEYEEQHAPADDILDTPPAKASYSAPDLAAAEDKIDQDENSGPNGLSDAPVDPAAPNGGSDTTDVPFDMNDVAGMPF